MASRKTTNIMVKSLEDRTINILNQESPLSHDDYGRIQNNLTQIRVFSRRDETLQKSAISVYKRIGYAIEERIEKQVEGDNLMNFNTILRLIKIYTKSHKS